MNQTATVQTTVRIETELLELLDRVKTEVRRESKWTPVRAALIRLAAEVVYTSDIDFAGCGSYDEMKLRIVERLRKPEASC